MQSKDAFPDQPSLSDAEWEVMNVLWARAEPMAARDVHAALGHRDWAMSTVRTLLSRLVAKGAIHFEAVANAYLYRPAIEREALARRELPGFIDRVLGGALTPALLRFIEQRGLTDDEADRLRELLQRRDQQKPPRGLRRRKED